MDYTHLSLSDIRRELEQIARDAQAAFGALDARQLNWKPDAARWSVAQCLEHLLAANRLMIRSASDALSPAHARTLWQRLPGLPRLLGPMMVRSQAPESTRRFTAPPAARPATSDVAADIVERFVEQHRNAAGQVSRLDEGVADATIMASPFMSVITYSVLDGWRLMVAHDRRHLAQARRAVDAPGFPVSA